MGKTRYTTEQKKLFKSGIEKEIEDLKILIKALHNHIYMGPIADEINNIHLLSKLIVKTSSSIVENSKRME